MRTVLTIAGFDPSSGAGVTADLMVFAAHGLFGTSCITALTVQSTLGVSAIHPVTPEIVRATLARLHDDLPAAGIKIGMLGTAAMVEAVAAFLEQVPAVAVVLDPVVRSSSGRELLSPEGLALLRTRLLPRVTMVTPNLEELSALTGERVTTEEEMVVAARSLQRGYAGLAVLATGGHLDRPHDLLLTAEGAEHWLAGERVETLSTHGTGCAHSSALLSGLVRGQDVLEAAWSAKRYVETAMRTARPRGYGRGPLHHLWPLQTRPEELL